MILCTPPSTPQGRKLLYLLERYEQHRRSPASWGFGPDYAKAIDALKARLK